MKRRIFVLFLAFFLVFAMSSSLVSSHKINNFNDPSANTHVHYDKLEIEIPDDEEDFFKNDTRLYFESGSPDLIDKNDNLYISLPNYLIKTKHPNKYSDGIHQITDKGADPSGEWIGITNPRFQDAPRKTSYIGGTDNTYVEYNFSLTDSELNNYLETPEDGDYCGGEYYVLNEDWGGSSSSSISCLANYSADSRCYSSACRTCIDFDSSDGVSGNLTEQGKTWNASYDFEEREGKQDYCVNSTHLVEYSCSGSGTGAYIKPNRKDCTTDVADVPYRCEDGACVCDPVLDYKIGSCTKDELATLWDAKCQILDPREVHCDYNNMGVIGDAIPFDSVKIDGEEYDETKNYTNTGTKQVEIMKDSDVFRFEWDTEDTGKTPVDLGDELNLEAINFSSSDSADDRGYILLEGVNRSKTVLLDKFTNSNKVCIKDSKGVDSLDEISEDCSGSNEVQVSCPGSSGNYNCEVVKGGSHYKVWPLQHSGVAEVTDFSTQTQNDPNNLDNQNNNDSDNDQNNDSDNGSEDQDSGSGSDPSEPDATSDDGSNKCTRDDWSCTTWGECSDGEKERVCSKKFDSSCSGGTVPEETSTEGCSTGGSSELDDTTQDSSDGLPGWALAAIIGGVALLVAIIVFFIVANKK